MKLAAALIPAATLAALLINPVSASAAGPFQYQSGGGCYSGGGGKFACEVFVTGGTGPFTTSWTNGTWATFSQVTYDGFDFLGNGTCTIGKNSTLTMTVTDSTGQHYTAGGVLNCTAQSQL
jgi:hypothetical protein